MQSLPYELRALEAALSTVAKILEREVKSLEDTLAPGENGIDGWGIPLQPVGESHMLWFKIPGSKSLARSILCG